MANLLDRIREAIRVRHYSLATERNYVQWVRRFIFFHGKRHSDEMGKEEIDAFLTDLTMRRKVLASTQNQALQGWQGNQTRVFRVCFPKPWRSLACSSYSSR